MLVPTRPNVVCRSILPACTALAAADGTIYCVWKYWGNGNAEGYYAVRGGTTPPPTGTIAGIVRDQFGVGVPAVSVTTTGARAAVTGTDGSYTLSHPAGTYNINAARDYYTGQTVSGVNVQVGQVTTDDLQIIGQAPPPRPPCGVISIGMETSTRRTSGVSSGA